MLSLPATIFLHILYHFSKEVMLIKWLKCAAVLIFITDYVLSQRTSRRRRSNDYVPCENGWFYYNEKCYKIGGATERLNYEKSKERCESLESNLVTIESKEENDFLVGLVILEVKDSAWIGLHDRENESDYHWVDGSTTPYRNWRELEPSGPSRDHEDCVHIIIDLVHDSVGQWNDNDCGYTHGYICEKKSDPDKRSPNPRYCTSDAGGGFRFDRSCYHLVTVMQTWEDAEKHCVDNYKGHLVTVLDTTVDLYLYYLLQSLLQTELWIGIKMQDRFQQKWTSGWYVGYNGFGKTPRDFLEGTCVARKKRKQWSIVPCSKKYSFICEISFANAPVLKPPPKDSHCPKEPEGWRDLDGEFCYFVELKNTASWYEASFQCMTKGGHLVSLHSKEESDLLHPFIHYTGLAAYIGIFKREGTANTFGWTDGSQVDFLNWSPWEPNNENEKCMEARSTDMKWNDITCTDKRAYICSTKKITPKSTALDKKDDKIECPGGVSVKALIGVVVCIIVVLILLGVVIYYFRPWNTERRKSTPAISLSSSSPAAVNRQKYRSAEIRGKEPESYYETMEV